MAEHRIEMTAPSHEVVNSDVDFWIYGDEKQLGHLHVSRGGMDWFPGSSRVNKYSLSWEQLNLLLKNHWQLSKAIKPKKKRK